MKDIRKGAISFDDFLKEELKDPKFKKAYDDLELEYQIINLMIRLRIEKKLTQKQIAQRIGIKQPVISQFERGNFNPSIKFLKKLAKGLDAKLTINISSN